MTPVLALSSGAAAAIGAALELGYPVVLKAVLPEISHKTEAGGVRVDVRNGDEVGKAYQELCRQFRQRSLPVLVQKMVRGGREVILGSLQDRQFGTLIMFGLGGIFVEAMRDVTFRIHPITNRDAQEMIASLRSYALLKGFRGERGVDERVLVEMLLRLSQLLSDFPEVEQVDINPFIVAARRRDSFAVDARISLAPH